ncbi:HAMP domain-containing protein [Thauera sp. CAU 1555]|uniref:histidine kinase n=1 Tax=Thauera sedimentorum TaxID=2767595 RepID=A0ABR9B8J7_9RHOO|nr:ATP-binding protein [Thauera sedimentorum]MBC9070926.1 HAMP domain-containing protein [Thauera sedimentorum]MBD8501845.1 HAMP domain-containing protein [Thauera sedimentorum]
MRINLDGLGIRAKLLLLFVVIKVVPLVLLAVLAWEGVTHLGGGLAERISTLAEEVRRTVTDMGDTFTEESVKALDDRAREEIERLTTDTARAIADFLHDRDRDVLLAAQLEPTEAQYRAFVENRSRRLVARGEWELSADGAGWVQKQSARPPPAEVSPGNAENQQDFHYRPPEEVLRAVETPLYHEITFVGLDGRERLKVSRTGMLPSDLRDVSDPANTWSKAETYFEALRELKPGEIYVSEVIGPYVSSRMIGTVTPDKARRQGVPFEPENEAYAGRENPLGKRFQGIVRWATPVTRNGIIIGYVTLALDHTHVMSFTDNLLPTAERYAAIADAADGNYAFIWDYLDRNIAHPRHHSIAGFDPETGERAVPWLEQGLYSDWQRSGLPLRAFLDTVKPFDAQTRDKKPAAELTRAGMLGLECRYLNFAPQCQGWHDLTEQGGSGSFLILWSGVWKLTTAAAIPYHTGQYARTPRGFGYVTIGANVDDFHEPARATARLMEGKVAEFGERMKQAQAGLKALIDDSMARTAFSLSASTLVMIAFVVVVAIWLASMLTRRITDVTAGLTRIEAGDFDYRFRRDAKDELGRLNEALNKMADSVSESFQRLEEARRQAEDNSRMKSDFVASMSHELRTPLNGILGFAELIRSDAPNDEIREQADIIYQSGQHLLSLVNDILDIAKIESGHMSLESTEFALRPLLQQLTDLHGESARQKGLTLTTDFSPALPETFVGDPTRLRQVMNNLLGNAVKFTREGGVVFSARQEDGRLVVGVRDSGPGIEQDLQPVIFERFRQASSFITREHGGTGLGLALVREVVALMGGEVRLESAPGKGAYFEFRVPLVSRKKRP